MEIDSCDQLSPRISSFVVSIKQPDSVISSNLGHGSSSLTKNSNLPFKKDDVDHYLHGNSARTSIIRSADSIFSSSGIPTSSNRPGTSTQVKRLSPTLLFEEFSHPQERSPSESSNMSLVSTATPTTLLPGLEPTPKIRASSSVRTSALTIKHPLSAREAQGSAGVGHETLVREEANG